MTFRRILVVGALDAVLVVGCGGARPEGRPDGTPALIAYAGPVSDVMALRAPRADGRVVVERIPEEILRDPARVVALRRWMEMQIDFQTKGIPEERYQHEVRPRLDHELRGSGLAPADVDFILRGVDYHRSL
jgi:hypothetical protein